MQSTDSTLKIISSETKDSIDQMSVVTPSVYASIFATFAQNHDTVINNEEGLASDLILSECTEFTNLQVQTAKNAQLLTISTNKAIGAIKDKDDLLLSEVLEETENLRQEIEKLKESIYKDELTNTFNRKWLHDHILNEDAQTLKDDGVLAIIDLNYFKIINDTYGHIVGDKVLIFISNQLKKMNEPIIRYGGDEFIIICSTSKSEKNTINRLNTIRESLLKKQLKVKDASFRISFSIGAYRFKKDDILTDIIEKADANMYEDKIKIKNRITGIN